MKNSKTLKQLILGGFFLLGSVSLFAQTQKVQTLQAKNSTTIATMNSDALIQMDSDNKGLLLPRIALTGANKVAPLTAHTAGMVVYNTANVPASGTGATAIEAVTPGYYYNDGTKWVKISSTDQNEWSYNPTTKQIDLVRSDTAPFTNKVYYTEKGAYKDYDETSIVHYNFGGLYTEDLVTGGNVLQRNAVNVEGSGSRILSRNHLNLTSNDPVSTTDNTRVGAVFNVNKYAGNNNNYRHIVGLTGGYKVGGGGTDREVSGSRGLVYYGQGSTANVSEHATGLRGIMVFNSSGTAKTLAGGRFNATQGANAGNITNLMGTTANTGINGSSSIANVYGFKTSLFGTGTANITNTFGFHYRGARSNLSANITNAYGLYIDDIEKGTTNNFAIYTKKGTVYHHDKMGIGTLTPTEKLEVVGKVKATGFMVGTTNLTVPDYVFEKYYEGFSKLNNNYIFRALPEVEAFIKKNGHLPGYVSAKEVAKAKSFDMTATQLTNIEKIEELYLHTIEQDKKLKVQQQQIEELKAQNKRIEALVTKLMEAKK